MTFGEEIEAVRQFVGLQTFEVNVVIPMRVEFFASVSGGNGWARWEWDRWEKSDFTLRDRLTWAALTCKATCLADKAEKALVIEQAERAAGVKQAETKH